MIERLTSDRVTQPRKGGEISGLFPAGRDFG